MKACFSVPVGMLATAGICVAAIEAEAAHPEPDGRPNILVIVADDWGWPHASAYGDKTVRTPNFDRVGREGTLFSHAFVSAPSCTPSRAALLTGQDFWRLGSAANLWGTFPDGPTTYPDLFAAAGYATGSVAKDYGPGKDRSSPVAGPDFGGLAAFLDTLPKDRPFCFWQGSKHPHRPFKRGLGEKNGIAPDSVSLPPYFPDRPDVRADIADYYGAVKLFDEEIGMALAELEKRGLLEETIVVVTSDNGWPFARGKSNLYDAGVRVPLAIRWGRRGQVDDTLVNLTDIAPTLLQAAGLPIPEAMTGSSLLGLLEGKGGPPDRTVVLGGKERHTPAQAGSFDGTPARYLRTKDHLYIRNLKPERWPVGTLEPGISGRPYSDTDDGPAFRVLLEVSQTPGGEEIRRLCFDRRPAEELYEVATDPWQLKNRADDPKLATTLQNLRHQMDESLRAAGDPRATGTGPEFDQLPYEGRIRPQKPASSPGSQ
jgi:N-sulfoglucosamine sulfohydrolase